MANIWGDGMSTSKHIDRICCAALALALIAALLLLSVGDAAGAGSALGYEDKLFDCSEVHTIDISMDDWEGFIAGCEDEEYAVCDVSIDGETYKNVGIRAKGNTSLKNVSALGSSRYSFKLEFDHYDDTISYHGLDKLSLNNIIQDNTYMKDFLCYTMMSDFGADAPLCSYCYITVNGSDWGLYLAVEGVEESFLQRNYGSDYGELYKPDSSDMGGGRGNGGGFDAEDFDFSGEDENRQGETFDQASNSGKMPGMDNMQMPENGEAPENGEMLDRGNMQMPETGEAPEDGEMFDRGNMQMPETGEAPENGEMFDRGNMQMPEMGEAPENGEMTGKGGTRGSSDVSLIYSDDDPDSYPNIFDNAKTDVTRADKARLIEALRKLNTGEDIESAVDIDEVMRYFVVHNFVCNFDSYTGSMIHNYYLYEEDGRLAMIPWDYNLAFGGFEQGGGASSLVNYPIDTPLSGGTVQSRPMLAWIFADDEYTELYHEYFAEFISELFDSGRLEALIDATRELIAPYVERDPTKFCTYEEFETGADTLREFCLLRAESVRAQLAGTIPSTDEGQAADSSALIDAGSLNISDMGSMGAMSGKANSDPASLRRSK